MKKVLFKNKHERIVAWMKRLSRMAKKSGTLVKRMDDGLELYELNGLHILMSDSLVKVTPKYNSIEPQPAIYYYRDNDEVSFFAGDIGRIQMFEKENGETETVIYLPDGIDIFSSEIRGINADQDPGEILEEKLDEFLTEQFKEDYTKALAFYRKIEAMMPGELRESIDAKPRTTTEKPEFVSDLSDASIEELRELDIYKDGYIYFQSFRTKKIRN